VKSSLNVNMAVVHESKHPQKVLSRLMLMMLWEEEKSMKLECRLLLTSLRRAVKKPREKLFIQ
jgi:hypothetical protein